MAKLSNRPRALTPALRVAAGAALACVCTAPHAVAQYSPTQEFQTGFSLLRFEPAKAGDRFFGVPDAAVPGNTSSRFRAQLLADFVTAPILARTNNLNGQTVDIISKQFLTHVGVGYFPIDQLLFSADLPLVLSQSGDSRTTPGAGIGDTRLGARYGLVGSENAEFSLAPALDVWVPTGSQNQLTGDGKLRAQPMLSFGGREDAFIWSAEIGYQLRRHIDIGSVEIGNSYAFGAAAGLLLFDDVLQVGPELYGAALSAPSHGSTFGSRNTVLEALFGAKVHAGDFAFGVAAGPGLSSAPGTAPRLLLSAAFAPQAPYVHEAASQKLETPVAPAPPPPPPDGDEDGVADADDACPAQKGVASDDKKKNGCPAPAPAPAATPATPSPGEEDTDGDGVPDNEDACKRVKGVASDTPKLNGCPPPPPPVDTDGDGVADADDACPKKKGVAASDPKLNGCPPPPPPKDTDADGIPDRSDACPRKKGVASDDPKLNGCPPPPPPPPPKDTDDDGIRDADDACPRKKGVTSDDPKLNGCPAPVSKAVVKALVALKAPPKPPVSTQKGDQAELTFAGFRSFDDGTSLVFVELSGPVTVDVKKARGAVVYTLENTKVPLRNNRNPLLTIDFSSIVRSATIKRQKKAVEITIALKADVRPEHRLVQRGGATVLEIQLPKAPPAPIVPPTPKAH